MEYFNEKTHALIAGLFYREFCGRDLCRGEKAFREGTIAHAEARGKRMAENARRDGEVLDFRSYLRYGEWRPSAYSLQRKARPAEVTASTPDRVIRIYSCLWHEQFQEMGLVEAEKIYCAEIDKAIVHGFNPDLSFATEKTLADGPYCLQRCFGAQLRENEDLSRREEYVRDFAFHCAASFYAYKQTGEAYFHGEGEMIAQAVEEAFAKEKGEEALAIIKRYEGYDFSGERNSL